MVPKSIQYDCNNCDCYCIIMEDKDVRGYFPTMILLNVILWCYFLTEKGRLPRRHPKVVAVLGVMFLLSIVPLLCDLRAFKAFIGRPMAYILEVLDGEDDSLTGKKWMISSKAVLRRLRRACTC
ncbi:uncharacterized protein LOC143026365 [Oratosquilla oratoria]|uniref:uncharacterized protein LOC143026365 n=1 Tax=Oratosquilla oratoria TaxID=337810 RepID=UPI003F7577A5